MGSRSLRIGNLIILMKKHRITQNEKREKYMKKIILLILLSVLCISCDDNRKMNFDVKVERNSELLLTMDGENNYNENYTTKQIFLSCRGNNCKIFEQNKLVYDKRLEDEEVREINRTITKMIKKYKEKPFIATNTITHLKVNEKSYEYSYVLEDEAKLFSILSYENMLLISDENYQISNKFTFSALNSYGSIWKIFCNTDKCEIFYYSNVMEMELTRSWNLKLSTLEIENLKKKLIDSSKNRYEKEIRSETNYRMAFENGKEYHYVVSNGQFEKILNGLIKGDYSEIEKEYIEKYSGS